jgi:conjugal transfer ATP-binding protein TraC
MNAKFIAEMLKRYRFSENTPIYAVDDNNHFYCEKDKSSSYIGASFLTDPIDGISQQKYIALVSTLSIALPPQSIIQFSYLSTNHIDERVNRHVAIKRKIIKTNPNISEKVRATLGDSLDARESSIIEAKSIAPIARSQVTARYNRVLLSIKIPVPIKSTGEEFQVGVDFIHKISDGMRNNLFPNIKQLNVNEFLAQCRSITYPFEDLQYDYDAALKVGEQIYTPTTEITVKNKDTFSINDVNYRMLSVKTLPPENTIALMNEMIGHSEGLYNQIQTPFLINCTFVTQDVTSKNQSIEGLFMQADDQCTPFAQKFAPQLKKRRDGMSELFTAVKDAQVPVEMTFNIFMFHNDMSRLNRSITSMQNFYKGFDFNMQPDTDIVLPMFFNAMPLHPSPESLRGSERHRTLTMKSGGTFIPLFSDYTGHYADFSQMFYTRRTALFGFDPTKGLNSNGMIFGGSGSGKSFFTQNFISQEAESGALIRVIDEGRSYMKLCEMLDGLFIAFDRDSKICLNPFTHVQDIDEDLEQLTAFFLQMAYPKGGAEDYSRSIMSEAIKSSFMTANRRTNVDNIIKFLRDQKDVDEAHRMATQLFKYGSAGPYGKWFNGENNLNLNNAVVVLELEDLKTQPELKTVVMMMLLSRIQFDMMKNTNYPRKFAFFEEVTSYLQIDVAATFIADFFARLRKYGAGTWLITQSMSSLNRTPAIDDMINNCDTRIYLKHPNESEINLLVDKGYIPNDPMVVDQIKSLHTYPNEFSEAYILRGNQGQVVRVALPRFFQVLYSSKDRERSLIQECQKAGVPVTSAIQEFLRFENRNEDLFFVDEYFRTWAETSRLARDWMIPYEKYEEEFKKVANANRSNLSNVNNHFAVWVKQNGSDINIKSISSFGLDGQ